MKFTEHEKKLIDKLHKENSMWKKWGRYVTFIAGLIGSFGSIAVLVKASSLLTEYPDTAGFVAIIISPIYLLCIASGYILGKSIFQWKGDPVRILLLKLLKDNIDK